MTAGRVLTIKNVPSAQKADVVAVNQAGGATVKEIDQGNGLFTIVATYPDVNDAPAPQPPPAPKPPPVHQPPPPPVQPQPPAPQSSAKNGADVLATAKPHISEAYIFGSKADYRNANYHGPWDCAEFATWCVFQTFGIFFGCDSKGTPGSAFTGLWKDDAQSRGQLISIEDAIRTPGAFLLRYPVTQQKLIGHIVISVGDGSTIEAADQRRGVIAGTVSGRRWDTGVLLPGVQYGAATIAADVLRSIEFPNPDPRVKEIQLALLDQGFDPGPIDGLFSETTESAVANFQISKGLVVDGEVGPDTAAALFQTAATLPSGAPAAVAPTHPAASTKFDDLRQEYELLFQTMLPSDPMKSAIIAASDRVLAGQTRYQEVASKLGVIPWYVVGVINELEGGSRFTTHLHNGDPLTARTTHVPAGRPPTGAPPFTWEESAVDALTLQRFDAVSAWPLSRILFQLEGYNGFGYRRPNISIFTPYLWSGCQHYVKGKFGGDGSFNPDLVSQQIGGAVLLKMLLDRGNISIDVS